MRVSCLGPSTMPSACASKGHNKHERSPRKVAAHRNLGSVVQFRSSRAGSSRRAELVRGGGDLRAAGKPRYGCHELSGRDRLLEMLLKAGLDHPLAMLVRAVSANRERRHVASGVCRQKPHLTNELVAV